MSCFWKRPDKLTTVQLIKTQLKKSWPRKAHKNEAAYIKHGFTAACCFLLTFAIVLSAGFKDSLQKQESWAKAITCERPWHEKVWKFALAEQNFMAIYPKDVKIFQSGPK